MDREYQIREAAEALLRYGGEPAYDEFVYALWHIAELNDDVKNGMSLDIIRKRAAQAKEEIDKIVKLAEATD